MNAPPHQHPARAAILAHLETRGAARAAELTRALELDPDAVTAHLHALLDARHVEERRGAWVRCYRPASLPAASDPARAGEPDEQLVDRLGNLISELTRLRTLQDEEPADSILDALIENLDVARLTLTSPIGPPRDWQQRAAETAERFLASRGR